MVRWTIVIGAGLVGAAVAFYLAQTFVGLTPAGAVICAAAVAFGVGVVAHVNTPDSEDLEDSLE